MGSGASSGVFDGGAGGHISLAHLPLILTKEQVQQFSGEEYDDGLFNAMADSRGTITKEQLIRVLTRTDVFLTHDWGHELGQDNHAKVGMINRLLKERGLSTWFDEDKMEGNIKKQMASGIDNAQCVVVFITKRYVDKVGGTNPEDNCQLEFNYAARRKGANKMIGVVMEQRMSDTSTWVGEVGLVLGGRLYADMTGDFTDSEYLNRCADDLFNRIMKVIGKPVPTFDIQLDAHVHHPAPLRDGGGGGGGGGAGASGMGHQAAAPASNDKPLKKDSRPLDSLSIDEVSILLTNLKLGKFIPHLKENEVDGATLAMCKTEEEIVEVGVSMQLKARVLFAKIQIYKIEGVPLTDLEGSVVKEDKISSPQEVAKERQATPKKEIENKSGPQSTSSSGTAAASSSSSSSASAVSSSSSFSSTESIGLHGTTGSCSIIDGIYEITQEIFGGMKRYKKRSEDHWLEYHSDQGRWHCKPTSKKGTCDAWAYLTCDAGSLPYETTNQWYVFDGTTFHCQAQISTYSALPFRVYGSQLAVLNGSYVPSKEMYSNVCRYQKKDASDYWFEYSTSQKQWHITRHCDKGTQQAFAYSAASKSPPWKQNLSWYTFNGSSFDANPNMIIIPEPTPLEVSGGSGTTAAYVAGIYDPTEEIYGGWVRYRKRTDRDSWMEYLASQKQWHIKPTSSKTQTNAWVMIATPLQDPAEVTGSWSVYNGSAFIADSGLKVKRV